MIGRHRLSIAAVLSTLLLGSGVLLSCGNRDAAPTPDAGRDDGSAEARQEGSSLTGEEVAYDDKGLPLPHPRRLGQGTPIPSGFKLLGTAYRRSTFGGPIPEGKVVDFYREYLLCSFIEQRRKAWYFKQATPESPGDQTRTVDVLVMPRGRKASRVTIIDLTPLPGGMGDTGPPDPQFFENFRSKAHGGIGSVTEPIPGTY